MTEIKTQTAQQKHLLISIQDFNNSSFCEIYNPSVLWLRISSRVYAIVIE